MIIEKKYDFSFTAASLRLNEMLLVLNAWEIEKREIDFTNELGNGKQNTGKRLLLEFKKRIESFTQEQKNAILTTDSIAQKQIALVGICKTYTFIRDFVVEVLREKVLVFDYQITEGEYMTFCRRKAELHPEIEQLSESSQLKIKQVTFKILEQVGIIDSVKSKIIQPQLISQEVKNVVFSDSPSLLKVLFVSDYDILTHTSN